MNRGRTIGVLTLLGLLLLHSLSLTAVWAEFKWRQAELERTRCENRLRPEMQCHAHCVLKKRLLATEQASSPVQVKPGQIADLFLPPAPLVLVPAAVSWPALDGQPAPRPGPAAYDRYEAVFFQPPDGRVS